MTFDSTTGQLVVYVNGQAVNSQNSPGAIASTSRNVFIGREDSLLPRPFNGLVDEVAVYNRALSASEIQAIYSAGTAGKCKSGSGSTGGGGTGAVCDPAFAVTLDAGNTFLPGLDIGSASVSKKATQDLYVQVFAKNTGSMVTGITGVNPPFSLAVPSFTSFGVGANSWQGFHVVFAPTATGPQNATMVISTSDTAFPASQCKVPLTGTGIP